jgi:hypothetical protein
MLLELRPEAASDLKLSSSKRVQDSPLIFPLPSTRARPDEVIDAQSLGFIHNKPNDFVQRHRVALSYGGGKRQQIKRQCHFFPLSPRSTRRRTIISRYLSSHPFPHIPENARTLQEPILARLAFCRRGGHVGMLIDCLGRKFGGAGGSFCGGTSW